MKEKIKKRILPTLLISCVLPLIVFLSTTFDVFAGNYSEFVFSFANFFGVCVGFFVLSTALIFLLLLFLPPKAYKIISALLLGFAFMMFMQGNFLNGGLATLKGDGEAGSVSTWFKILDIVIWVVVIIAFVVVSIIKDKRGIISSVGFVIACVILATQVITPVITAVSNREMFLTFQQRMENMDTEYKHRIATNKNLTTSCSEGNIYVFCIDKFDEQWAENIYDEQPELFDMFEGFTWFQDHVSIYGHTYPSVVNMLTEVPFTASDEPSRVEYLNKSYENATKLQTLQANGWKINLYTEKYYAYSDAFYLPDFIGNKAETAKYKIINQALLGLNMVKLGLYRTMPFVIKDLFNNLSTNTFSDAVREIDNEGNSEYLTNNEIVDNLTKNSEFTTLDGKGFYFIHTLGMHNAFQENERIPTFKISTNIVNRYITYLKEQGLFEKSTIIVLGDHGNGAPYRETYLKGALRTALLIKPAGVNGGKMKISQAQTSHDQLWTTILEEANINEGEDFGTSILETPEGDDQERYFVWHTYNNHLTEYHYVINGTARDFDNWELVNEYSFNRHITD